MLLGWTWISLPIVAADMSVAAVISHNNLAVGNSVKGQFDFTDYYGSYGW
jgi:hypothetical protein